MPKDTDLKSFTGLSANEVKERLERYGYNELPSEKKQNIFVIFLNLLREPMLVLLLAVGLIYLLVGEFKDAVMLLAAIFVVVGITFIQERKTKRALEALRSLSSPRALVIRNRAEQRIPGREVVKNDIVVLREGDRVPADGVVLSSVNFYIDESLLTGESMPVRKSEWDGKMPTKQPGGDDLPFVYSGTLVTQGRAVIEITSTGLATEMGKIGKSLQTIHEEEPLLKKETRKLVRNFALAGTGLCVLVVILYGLTRGDWVGAFLAGLTLSMSMLPEEFPVVLLIFLSLGAWEISKRKVLARHSSAIETLGATKVLCVDKTGTLTLNRMRLEALSVDGRHIDIQEMKDKILPETYHTLLEYAILSSQQDPFDPIEKAINFAGEKFLHGTDHIHKNWELVHEYPLSKKLLSLSHVWASPDKEEFVIAAKGAPEAIADLCHLNKMQEKELMNQIEKLSGQGMRLLGVAKALFNKGYLPKDQHEFRFEFVGLLGFADPVRPGVADSIQECYAAGMRVIMITGDYPGTAQFTARQIGLESPEFYLTGQDLQKLTHEELREKIKEVNIFARIMPEQKLFIVDALKANGEIVAMTGDGVNDAPALKSAHIGIAMGERGTDVAREASDIVLLNDDFSSIVRAVRLGRKIFDNLRKAMTYIFAIHIPIAGMAFFPVLFNLPIVLLPALVAFLELIIDPACSIVFESEKEEYNVMKRPPRDLKIPLFDKKRVILSVIQGLSMLVLVFSVFAFILHLGKSDTEIRTITFFTIVLTNLVLITVNLSWTDHFFKTIFGKNRALFFVIGGAITCLLLILYIPSLNSLFHFSFLSFKDLLIPLVAGLVAIVWFEGLRRFLV